ncbi:hypothetical protein EI613_05595 [Azospirillum sp. 412522]|nr:hypothetical protein [Azospirillum sp. 412522]MBY6261404.1 hypothetical protein [Azospirillum sp. 412522]
MDTNHSNNIEINPDYYVSRRFLLFTLFPIAINLTKPYRKFDVLYADIDEGEKILKSINKLVSRDFAINSVVKIEKNDNSDIVFAEMKNGIGIIHFGIDCYIDVVRSFSSSTQILFGIMSHECWHVYQFLENQKRISPFFELEAYLACGYYLGLLKREEDFPIGGIIDYLAERNIEGISENDHGTSEEVERCIISGFKYAIINGPKHKKELNAYFRSQSGRVYP